MRLPPALRDRRVLVASVLLALGAGAGAVVGVASRSGGDGCVVRSDLLDPAAASSLGLVPVSQLLPAGSVAQERRPVLHAVAGLGGPVGEVVAGRFYAAGEEVPALARVGDRLLLVGDDPSTTEPGGLFAVVDPAGEGVGWARRVRGGPARGGLVGDDLVVLIGDTGEPDPPDAPDRPGGGVAAVVAWGVADGEGAGCVTVATRGAAEPLATDQAGSDVVALTGTADRPRLTGVRPVPGDVRWAVELDPGLSPLDRTATVLVSGGLVLVNRWGADPVRLAEAAAAGGVRAEVGVAAFSLAGRARWVLDGASAVLAEDADGGRLAVARVRVGREATTTRVEVVDAAGATVWSRPLGRGLWGQATWAGPTLVVAGTDGSGGGVLRGLDGATGRTLWTVRSQDLRPRGEDPRTGFGGLVVLAGGLVAPSPNGLVRIDPVDGDVEMLDSRVRIEQVVPLGGLVAVRTARALLVARLVGEDV